MKEFFRKYVLMMGVPRAEQIAHWILFTVFIVFDLGCYIGGGLFAFLIVTFISGGFWLVHALYTRYRYDVHEELPLPCAPP